jgi:hypothetical protein
MELADTCPVVLAALYVWALLTLLVTYMYRNAYESLGNYE